MNTDICGNCKLFDKSKQMINGNYKCIWHEFTVNPLCMGCYKIQNNKKLIKN